jgi:hypothetical protein
MLIVQAGTGQLGCTQKVYNLQKMPLLAQIVLIAFSLVGLIVGFLMLFAPTRYPNLYVSFLNEYIVRRETSEHGRVLAIRATGLVMLTTGAFFGLFVWAIR